MSDCKCLKGKIPFTTHCRFVVRGSFLGTIPSCGGAAALRVWAAGVDGAVIYQNGAQKTTDFLFLCLFILFLFLKVSIVWALVRNLR